MPSQVQARTQTDDTDSSYGRAVDCAGALRMSPGFEVGRPNYKAYWRYNQLALDMGRRKGLSNHSVDRALVRAQRRSKGLSRNGLVQRAKACLASLNAMAKANGSP